MKILRSEKLGICGGVRRAMDICAQISDPQAVSIYGELVHNSSVQYGLKRRGFDLFDRDNTSLDYARSRVLIPAHGTGNRTRKLIGRHKREMIDATCPLVARIHRLVLQLEKKGWFPVIIGSRDHVEVKGLTEDLQEAAVVKNTAQAVKFKSRKIAVLVQTTVSEASAAMVLKEIRKKNPGARVKFFDTICRVTRERQLIISNMIREADVLLAIGGANSNNTRELYLQALVKGVRAWHIQNASQLKKEWFRSDSTVALAPGTSTPAEITDCVYERLKIIEKNLNKKSRRIA